MPKTKRSTRREPIEIGEAEIHEIALGYLNRFDASVAGLRKTLLSRVERSLRRAGQDAGATERRLLDCRRWIDQLIARFQASGVLDDRRYATSLVGSLRRRGVSARAIQSRLAVKGISASVVQAALLELGGDPYAQGSELDAAIALARRRKLGRFGATTDRKQLHKDLATLARAGFDYDVAVRALGQKIDDDGDVF